MKMEYIMLVVFIFVILHLALIPLGNTAFSSESATHLNTVSTFGVVYEEKDFGWMTYVKAPFEYFNSLFWLMYHGVSGSPIFEGQFQIIGWLLLAPIAATIMFGLILTFFTIVRRTA